MLSPQTISWLMLAAGLSGWMCGCSRPSSTSDWLRDEEERLELQLQANPSDCVANEQLSVIYTARAVAADHAQHADRLALRERALSMVRVALGCVTNPTQRVFLAFRLEALGAREEALPIYRSFLESTTGSEGEIDRSLVASPEIYRQLLHEQQELRREVQRRLARSNGIDELGQISGTSR